MAWTRRELMGLLGATAGVALLGSCRPRSGDSIDFASMHYRSLADVARLIQSRQLSPVALTVLMLDRINKVDSRLHSYATLMADRAMTSASKAEQEINAGVYRGPLHGIPVAVKDLCYTKGVRTMGGLKVRSGFIPDYDATVVARLEQAGAVLLGKLALTEGAMGGYHRDFEIPINPWREDIWPGASSSGSGVAAAAGLCFAAIGTDAGGSIRLPSMANGTVGLKPTYGRVSRHGVLPLAETLDHVGPMTRSVADAALMFQAIAGADPNDPTSLQEPVPDLLAEIENGVAGLRIGFDERYAKEGVDPGLVSAIDAALEELKRQGAEIVPVEMPDASAIGDAWFQIASAEAVAAHAEHYPSRAEEYGGYFGGFLEFGAGVTEQAHREASAQRAEFSDRFREVLSSVDVMASPAGGVPFPLDHELQYGPMSGLDAVMPNVQMHFTIPANFAGTPALALPCGFSEDGLPYTIQFMGDRLTEPTLCRVGHAYEQATGWSARHPDV